MYVCMYITIKYTDEKMNKYIDLGTLIDTYVLVVSLYMYIYVCMYVCMYVYMYVMAYLSFGFLSLWKVHVHLVAVEIRIVWCAGTL